MGISLRFSSLSCLMVKCVFLFIYLAANQVMPVQRIISQNEVLFHFPCGFHDLSRVGTRIRNVLFPFLFRIFVTVVHVCLLRCSETDLDSSAGLLCVRACVRACVCVFVCARVPWYVHACACVGVCAYVYTVFCPGFQKGRVPSEKGTLAR